MIAITKSLQFASDINAYVNLSLLFQEDCMGVLPLRENLQLTIPMNRNDLHQVHGSLLERWQATTHLMQICTWNHWWMAWLFFKYNVGIPFESVQVYSWASVHMCIFHTQCNIAYLSLAVFAFWLECKNKSTWAILWKDTCLLWPPSSCFLTEQREACRALTLRFPFIRVHH